MAATKHDVRSANAGAEEITRELAASLVPKRAYGAHKWGVGGLVLIAGSPGYAGAAILSALAAGRAGAGIVSLAAPRGVAAQVVSASPETTTVALPDFDPAGVGRKAVVEELQARIAKSAAVLIGPGLGDDESTEQMLAAMFGKTKSRGAIGFGGGKSDTDPNATGGLLGASGKPLVIDADALNWLAKQDNWSTLLPAGRAVLTPHVGELGRLLGKEPDELIADPVETSRTAARAWGQTVVFKYGRVTISDGETTRVASDAPVSLASAGTGDVLAGTIGALVAQGLSGLDAATLAVTAGNAAARRVEETVGVLGLVAGDLPLAIATELALLAREGENAGE